MIIEKNTSSIPTPGSPAASISKLADLNVQVVEAAKKLHLALAEKESKDNQINNLEIINNSLTAKIEQGQSILAQAIADIEKSHKSFEFKQTQQYRILTDLKIEISNDTILISGLRKELEYLISLRDAALPLEEKHSKLIDTVNRLESYERGLNQQIDDLEIKFKQKQERELQESEVLKKERIMNEEVLLNIQNSKNWLVEEKERLQEFCAAHNVPFELSPEPTGQEDF